jgi:hypothetical protein
MALTHPVLIQMMHTRAKREWRLAGSPEGRDLEFWLIAEREMFKMLNMIAFDIYRMEGYPQGQAARHWDLAIDKVVSSPYRITVH